MKKRKILFLVDSFNLGGCQKVTSLLARSLDRERFEPHFAALSRSTDENLKDNQLAGELESEGIETFSFDREPHRMELGPLARIRRFLKSRSIDVIQTACQSPDLFGQVAAFWEGVPVRIRTFHGDTVWGTRARLARNGIEPFLRALPTRNIAVSASCRDNVAREINLNAKRIQVIPNAIDLAPFNRPLERDSLRRTLGLPSVPLIGFVGRLSPEKDPKTFILAAEALLEHPLSPAFVLVGDSAQRPELERLATDLGLAGRVFFLGWRHDMAEMQAIFDLFVVSSLRETCCLAMLEAFASGTPVVATDIDGFRGVLVNERNALLVPPREPEALAEAISRLLSDPRRACAMAREGRRHVESLDLSSMVRLYEKAYLDVEGRR